ncbi:MAG: hypothetical protein Q9208_004671 [Pyrenodesmia sp. 3 TL-2023]
MKVTATLIVAAAALGAKVALAAPVVEHEAGVNTVAELVARGNVIRQNSPISGPPPPGPQCLPDGWCGASNAGIGPSCCSKHAINNCCVATGPGQKKRATPPLCVAGANCSQGSPAGPKPDPKPDPEPAPEPSPSSEAAPSPATSTDPPPLLTGTPVGTMGAPPPSTSTDPPPLLTGTPVGTMGAPPLPMQKRAEEFTAHVSGPVSSLHPSATQTAIAGIGDPHSTVHGPTPATHHLRPTPEETNYGTPRATATERQHHIGPGWSHTVAIRPFPTTLATVVDKRDVQTG